ncbi:MAG: hypothetical protein AAF798_15475 [Bacteroidota bacterium]
MKRYFLLPILLTITFSADGQNLIPNPSFEAVSAVTDDKICASRADFDGRVQDWFSPTDVSPDVYRIRKDNSLLPETFRLPQPVDGQCLAGIMTNYPYNICQTYREYISIPLKEPLAIDEYYVLEFWVTPGESDTYQLGVYFSEEKIDLEQCGMLEFSAQFMAKDTLQKGEWKKLHFAWKPLKPYTYLTVGNFERTAEAKRQYLFLDQFSLIKRTRSREE